MARDMSENVWRPDNVVQLVGHARFDMELEGWLKTKGLPDDASL